MIGQLIVDVSKPFVGVARLSLGLIAEQRDNVAFARCQPLTESADQFLALDGNWPFEYISAGTGGDEQQSKKRTFEVGSMVLARHPHRQDLRPDASQVEAHVVDGMGLAHSRPRVD